MLIAVIVQVSGHAGVDIPGLAADGAQHPTASTAPPPTAEADAAMAMAFALVGATVSYCSGSSAGKSGGRCPSTSLWAPAC
jgi:hypothetical protein